MVPQTLRGREVSFAQNSRYELQLVQPFSACRLPRGRKLGMLLTLGNLHRLAEQSGARRIYAWNAVEKDYMTVIDCALGFAVAGYAGDWTKQLEQ